MSLRPPALALIAFFLSGFAALLYQVVWQRLLVLFSGADVYSVTIIVAAFMAGLGIGNLVGGYVADRLTATANLLLFAGCEIAIAIFGAASKTIYYDVLYSYLPALPIFPHATAVLFVSLLWPTVFMGLSLPLLARALTRTLATAGPIVGALYGWNTMGAAAGAFATTWWLLPRVGLELALTTGATINVVCAAAAVLLVPQARRAAATALGPDVTAAPDAAPAGEPRFSFPVWACLYGVTGFSALALEMVWFRMLGVTLKPTAFTFGTLLCVYLAALGLGAAVVSSRVALSRAPGAVFLALQAGAIAIAGLSTVALLAAIDFGWITFLSAHVSGEEPFDVNGGVGAIREIVAGRQTPYEWGVLRGFLGLYAGVPLALIAIPTFLMGASFPYLQRAVQADFARIGRRVGLLMASNIAGSTLGAMTTGWLLLPWLGTPATLQLIVVMGALLGLLLVVGITGQRRVPRLAASGLLVAASLLAVFAIPNATRFWATLHGAEPGHVIVNEDGAGLSLLRGRGNREDGFDSTMVFVNGLQQSWIPYGNIHTALGAIPLLLHPDPREAVVIGLGSGDTTFALAGRPGMARVVSVEIIGAQLAGLERLAATARDPGLTSLLADPRIEHVVGDGRSYLLRTGRRFDIIEADALRPSSAYAGNLYSKEYFELVRSRLAPGGMAVTWAPTERVWNTFMTVFPHVVAFGDGAAILVGSTSPIAFDPEVLRARYRLPDIRGYYERAGIGIDNLLEDYLEVTAVYGPAFDRSELNDINTDLFPKDEFQLPRVLPY